MYFFYNEELNYAKVTVLQEYIPFQIAELPIWDLNLLNHLTFIYIQSTLLQYPYFNREKTLRDF